MKIQRKRGSWIVGVIVGLFLLLGNFAAYADSLLITLDPASLTVNPGQTQIEVFGTLTNISSDTIYINSDSITVPSAENLTDYFMNTPMWLDAGESSGLIELFSFDVLVNAALGSVIGNYTILGGDVNDPCAFDVLGSQDFTITIQNPTSTNPVPEPTTALLFGAGLMGLVAVTRRTRLQ